MSEIKGARLSTSTWALHRTLGVTYPDTPTWASIGADATYGRGSITLLELPARIAAMGIHTLEIVHFHLPSREIAYFNELRAALSEAGVELFSLLIDDGDITHPQNAERDLAWISGWVETAAAMGAKATRVIAGKAAPTEEALKRSIDGLMKLVQVGKANGVRVMTENWFSLLSTPDYVRRVLSMVDIGLCCDFGNWGGETKYEDLAEIMPFAESCHAKCFFSEDGAPNRDDYLRCLELAKAAFFNGPYTLIYDGLPEDEWAGLATEKAMVEPYLPNN